MGEQFLLCIRKDDADSLGFGDIPDDVAKGQRKVKVNGKLIGGGI